MQEHYAFRIRNRSPTRRIHSPRAEAFDTVAMFMFKRRDQIERRRWDAPPQGSGVGSLLSETAARIDELIATAERTASSVRDRAAAQEPDAVASRRERIVRELSLSLVDRVDALRDEATELRRALERAERVFSQSVPARNRDAKPSSVSPIESHPFTHALPPPIEPQPSDVAPSQGVILLATQMAVAGSGREEIAARLRNDFGVTDTEAVLTRALGAAR